MSCAVTFVHSVSSPMVCIMPLSSHLSLHQMDEVIPTSTRWVQNQTGKIFCEYFITF